MAQCSWNKTPQLEEQKLSALLSFLEGSCVCGHIWVGPSLYVPGPRHSNMVQVVPNSSFGIRCLHTMNSSLQEFQEAFLQSSALALEPAERSVIENSLILPLTTHTIPQTALIAPITVAFIFQNLWNYIFEGIIHFFPLESTHTP